MMLCVWKSYLFFYLGRVPQRSGLRRCSFLVQWDSRWLYTSRPQHLQSGCPPYWDLRWREPGRHNLHTQIYSSYYYLKYYCSTENIRVNVLSSLNNNLESLGIKHCCWVWRSAHWPASRVSTTKLELLKVVPWTRPSPWALTRLASPISDWTTMMVMGLLGTWRPFFRMLTLCSPTSRGMKEIPERRKREGGGEKR